MYTSKLKLIFSWVLFIIGTYLFWILSYFVLAKFALTEISNLQYIKGNIYEAIKLNNLFWYALYIGAIVLSMYIFRLFVVKSPSPKLAAGIYASLIIISEAVLIKELAATTSNNLNILPHIIINVCFLIAIVIAYFKFHKTAIA